MVDYIILLMLYLITGIRYERIAMIGISQRTRLFFLFLAIIFLPSKINGLTWFSRSDPAHVYSTLDPETFLQTRAKMRLKGEPVEYDYNEFMSLSFSPFGQNASIARDMNKNDVELGNIMGKRNFVPLMFGALPEGVSSFPTDIAAARAILFPGIPQTTPITDSEGESYIDRSGNIGYVSFPLKYRKWGVRGEFEFQITHGFGILLQMGVSDICQVPSPSYTCSGEGCCGKNAIANADTINTYLTCKYVEIGKELCLDFDTFHHTSFEDVALQAYWRHAYEVNFQRDSSWARFLAIPFFKVGGVLASAKKAPLDRAFSLSSGNDGYNAVGFDAGLNFDFVDTIEIGAKGGFTHFFERTVCQLPVPTSCLQSGIYPFRADVCYKPGNSWDFEVKMSAYHFLDRLSFFLEYVYITHEKDHIKIKNEDPAFKPKCLEDITCWQVQVANVAFNYDISPNLGLGVLWQAPLKQVFTYRSSLLMFSVNASF